MDGLAVTDHSFEDCLLMREAEALGMPMEVGSVLKLPHLIYGIDTLNYTNRILPHLSDLAEGTPTGQDRWWVYGSYSGGEGGLETGSIVSALIINFPCDTPGWSSTTS